MEDRAPDRRIRRRIADVCAALNDAGARYLVCGGAACVLHGYVRATTDVDILIEPTRSNIERILHGLSEVGYGFARELSADEILAKPITVIGDDPAVDVFHGLWGISYRAAARRAEHFDVNGVSVPVLALDDLIASKRSGRPLDVADVEVLEQLKRLRSLRDGPPEA